MTNKMVGNRLKAGLLIGIVATIASFASLSSIACKKEEQVPQQPQQPQQQQIPPEKIGPPTYVPKGTTVEKYVVKYYDAYKNKKWAEAYKMLPAINKAKENEKGFAQLRESMPIKEYVVSEVTKKGDISSIGISYSLGNQGNWTTVWTFRKKGDKLIAESSKAQMGSF